MKFYIDTEFMEAPGMLKLLSIGIVAGDGREYYAEAHFDERLVNEWVRANVLPHLQPEVHRVPTPMIREKILSMVGPDKPEFWGYYADYDWVLFCWLFGPMVALPRGWPMYCRDLKQELDRAGNPRVPFKAAREHHALSDARWIKDAHEWLEAETTHAARGGRGGA